MMNIRIRAIGACLMLPFLAGCVDNYESLSVLTSSGGLPLYGAQCRLSNRKGIWFVTTPGSVAVHLGSEDLGINCQKAGYAPVVTAVKSSVNIEAILLNGAIESTVSGSAWTYPQTIVIPMQSVDAFSAPMTEPPIPMN